MVLVIHFERLEITHEVQPAEPDAMSDHFKLGVAAAKEGKTAADCPYQTGANRKEWLAGYFSVRPPGRRSEV